MSLQPEISIIIPVFNLEKYIAATLESILIQKDISMEILIVDDGSTDRTKEVVKGYVTKYDFIKLFSNERKKGVSGARNTAINYIQGETCFFLDGDDLLAPNSLRQAIDFMKKNDACLVRTGLAYFCHQRWLYLLTKSPTSFGVKEFPTVSFAQFLYNTKLIKDNSLYFPEDLSVAEDRTFFCEAVCNAKHIAISDQYLYIYRINHKPIRSSAKHVLSFISHFKHIYEILKKHDRMDLYIPYMQSQFSTSCLRNAYYAMQESQEQAYDYLQACADIISDKEEMLAPKLNSELKEYSEQFWNACKKNDSKAMLEALEKAQLLRVVESYIGIKESQLKKHWFFIRLLHRIKNIITKPKDIPVLFYILKLNLKSFFKL